MCIFRIDILMEIAQCEINNWISRGDYDCPLLLNGLNLEELPPIPIECKILYCYGNRLTKLPALQNCTQLYCHCNKLVLLPELPKCVALTCWANELLFLSGLPQNPVVIVGVDKSRPPSPWLHITKRQARRFRLRKTPNYFRCAKVIQRTWRRYLRRKYMECIVDIVGKNVSGMIGLYVI